MKHTVWIAALGALLSATAVAETPINRTLDAAPDGLVEVSNVAGLIEIRGWSRSQVEVTGTLGDDVEELIFERDDDVVVIKVRVPRRHGRDIDSELYINIPERSSIEVSGVSADIDIDEVLGTQVLQTVSGDVEVRQVAGDFEVASVSGDVTISGTGVDADSETASVSGDVTVTNLAGRLEAAAVTGDVIINGLSFDAVDIETVNGDLEFDAELRAGGELSIETVNGDVDVQFRGDPSAEFDVETFNGGIRCCFGPEPERTSRYSPGLGLSFSEGGGNGRVSIETLNGDVEICKK